MISFHFPKKISSNFTWNSFISSQNGSESEVWSSALSSVQLFEDELKILMFRSKLIKVFKYLDWARIVEKLFINILQGVPKNTTDNFCLQTNQKLGAFWKAEIMRIQKMVLDVKINQVIAEKIKIKSL